MKLSCNRAFVIAVISSTFLLAATSCKKSNNNSGGGSMSATLNGTAWANNFPIIGLYINAGGLFELAGEQFKGGDSTAFAMEFTSPIVLNKTINADTSALIIAYTDNKTGVGYGALTGGLGTALITITSYDSTGHTIGGTFSGVLYNTTTFADSIIITNGKFNTSFKAQ